MLAAAAEATRGGDEGEGEDEGRGGRRQLLVWLGIMVATGLNCAATAHLLDLTPRHVKAFCDLDGNLLAWKICVLYSRSARVCSLEFNFTSDVCRGK